MSHKPLLALVVGCGNIAGIFDQERPRYASPLTHAGAYSHDKRFILSGCVDPNDKRREKFMNFWGVQYGFSEIEDVLNSAYRFDVISICSPSDHHVRDLEVAVLLRPKLIFCEKPLTISLMETETIVEKCRGNDILLAVNYSRRFDPDIMELLADMRAGRWGELRSVLGVYNKGLLNNGSHLIDLLYLLIGPLEIVKVGKPVQDFFSNDPTIPFWLEGPNGVSVHIACGNSNDYSIFEIQFVFSMGVLIMEDGGLYWRERRAVDSADFHGYKMLNKGFRRVGGYSSAMIRAMNEVYDAVVNSQPLASNGETALSTQRMCEAINQIARKQLG